MSIYRLTGSRELNVKAVVAAFSQENALVGAFSVIVRTDGSFAAHSLVVLPGGGRGGGSTRA